MSNFFELFQANLPKAILQKRDDGLCYISAGSAMQHAGRPDIAFVDFMGKPYLEMLGGAVVAIDITLPGGAAQRTWLPIMTQGNNALPLADLTLREVNDALQRCLVKAIAMTCGTGMSVFMGYEGSGESAAKALAVSPNVALAQVDAVTSTRGDGQSADYVEWSCAVAAARITDPEFHWEVVLTDGFPYRELLGGVLVDVDVTYQGRKLRLTLPVWDNARDFEPIPLAQMDVMNWNMSVMRCLTKAIAFNSGYGLSVYGKEGTVASKPARGKADKPAKAGNADKGATEKSAKPKDTPAPVSTDTAPLPADAVQVQEAARAPFDARFRGVLADRVAKGSVELLSLFGALEQSTKYTAEEKPTCFGILVEGAVEHVDPELFPQLLGYIVKHKAFPQVAEASREAIARKLVNVTLTRAVGQSEEAVEWVVKNLIEAGVAADFKGILDLADTLGMAQLDLIVDVVGTPA